MRTAMARVKRYRWWLLGLGVFAGAVAALLSSFVGPPPARCQVREIECLMPFGSEGVGPGLLAVCVTVTNRSHRLVRLRGDQFTLQAGWRSYPAMAPAGRGDRSLFARGLPNIALLNSRTIAPGKSVDGWVAFEGLVDDIRKPLQVSAQLRALHPALVLRDGLHRARYELTTAADAALSQRTRPAGLDPEFAVVEVPFGLNVLNLAPWLTQYRATAESAARDTILVLSDPHAHLDSVARLALVLNPPAGDAHREVVLARQGGDVANTALGINLPIRATENEAVIHLEGQRPDGRQRLIRALRSAEPPIRVAAVSALGGESPAWAELCRVLTTDPDVTVRRAAANQLGNGTVGSGPPPAEVATALGKALLDPDREVRTVACLAVKTHGLAPQCRDQIRALLTHGSPDQLAVRLAADAHDRELVPVLIGLLGDANVADDAADVLGKLGDRRAEPALRELLAHDGPGRTGAIWAIGRLGTRQDVPALADLFHRASRSGSVRRACVEAAARLGGPAAWDLVYEALADQTDTSAASKAATEIARFNDPRALPLLVKAARSNDPLLCQSALLGLTGITGPEADEALRSVTGTTDRKAIARQLGTNEH